MTSAMDTLIDGFRVVFVHTILRGALIAIACVLCVYTIKLLRFGAALSVTYLADKSLKVREQNILMQRVKLYNRKHPEIVPSQAFRDEARRIDTRMERVERYLGRIMKGENLLASIICDEEVLRARLTRFQRGVYGLLVFERAQAEALSPDPEMSERGVVNLAVNPMIRRTLSANMGFGILLAVIRHGVRSAKMLALYHIGEFVQDEAQIEELREIAAAFTGDLAEMAERQLVQAGERIRG